MAEGRWADDIRGGMPPTGNAGPRLLRYMKWTWPAALAAAIPATIFLQQYGWFVALILWFATCAIPYYYDQRAQRRHVYRRGPLPEDNGPSTLGR